MAISLSMVVLKVFNACINLIHDLHNHNECCFLASVKVGDNNFIHLEPVDDTAYVLNTDTMTWSDISSAIQPKEGGDTLTSLQHRRFGHSGTFADEMTSSTA